MSQGQAKLCSGMTSDGERFHLSGLEGTISGLGKVLYRDCGGVYISVYTFVRSHWTIK